MITLYHSKIARSLRPLWALEELGLPYELVSLPFPPRVFAKEYLGVNPLGTIPFMIDGDVRMSESAAIIQYLAARYRPEIDVGVQDPAFGAYLNWLDFGEATLTFPQTLVLRYTQLEPEARRHPQVVADYKKFFLGRLRVVDAAISKNEFLCANRFTMADISVGYALMLANFLKIDEDFSPAIVAYRERLMQRDGFKRAKLADSKPQTP